MSASDVNSAWRDSVLVIDALKRARLPFEDEKRLQVAIAERLTAAGMKFERECQLRDDVRPGWPLPLGFIDFLTSGGLGIEIKIKGSSPPVARQIETYAADPRIHRLLLVTSKPMAMPPQTRNGKPVQVLNVAMGWL